MTSWFDVDKQGLAQILERRGGKAFVLYELLQNAWDTRATKVEARVVRIAGSPKVKVVVTDDDPNGFANLAHAWTLFAPSDKKDKPDMRGRFNLGEKLVLALCEEADISTTTGTVHFDADGGRRRSRNHRDQGSAFSGVLRMTREEQADVLGAMRRLLPPPGVETLINGEPLPERRAFRSMSMGLPTEIADAEGYLRRQSRSTTVTLHELLAGEAPQLYEMGIPVQDLGEAGIRWHVNVLQKVPQSIERDGATPAFLNKLYVQLANQTSDLVTPDDANAFWLDVATESPAIEAPAVQALLTAKFGDKFAAYDPSDPEANKEVQNRDYTVVAGGSLSKHQWANAKEHGLIQPAGQIAPSGVRYDPNGNPERIVPPDQYTAGQRALVEFARDVALQLIGKEIAVKLVNEPIALPHAAWYGNGQLAFNVGRLGKVWFECGLRPMHVQLILHELAHDRVSDHLTREFSDELGRLGTKLVGIALTDPSLFHMTGYKP